LAQPEDWGQGLRAAKLEVLEQAENLERQARLPQKSLLRTDDWGLEQDEAEQRLQAAEPEPERAAEAKSEPVRLLASLPASQYFD
jgi:hypothetical protein